MGQPTEIVYVIEDNTGKTATTKVNLLNTVILSSVQIFGVAYATALNNLIGGRIRDAIATFFPNITGLTANTGLVSSDVEEIASFKFVAAAGDDVIFNLPCMDESYVISGSHDLDQVDSEVAAIVTMFLEGIEISPGVTIQPCDVGEEPITTFGYARERFRNSGSRR